MSAANVGIVLLAAGEGSRYGGIKQLAAIDGEPMARRAARAVLATGLPVVVVTGAHADAVEGALAGLPLRIARHADWRLGMGSSLAAGVRALRAALPSAGGALVCLADQPLLDARMLDRLLRRHAQAPDRILAASHADTLGPPVLFPRDCLDELAAWSGERGAQALLARESARVERFDFGAIADVDTPEDLRKAIAQLTCGAPPSGK